MNCPHGNKVKQTFDIGLTIYKHADGTFCDLLNGLNMSSEQVAMETKTQDPDAIKVLFKNNRSYRMKFYERMCTMKDEQEYAQAIIQIGNMMTDDVATEMVLLFGDRIRYDFSENGYVVTPNPYTYKLLQAEIKAGKFPKAGSFKPKIDYSGRGRVLEDTLDGFKTMVVKKKKTTGVDFKRALQKLKGGTT